MTITLHNLCILASSGILFYLAYQGSSLPYLAAAIFVLSFLATRF